MTTVLSMAKRKVSVSLDEDLVEELEAGGDTLSAQVNEAIRVELRRRRRQRLLGDMLDEWEQVAGPPDEDQVQRFMEILR